MKIKNNKDVGKMKSIIERHNIRSNVNMAELLMELSKMLDQA